MKTDVLKLDAGKAGSIDLDDAIFGLEPRADILHRVCVGSGPVPKPAPIRSRPARK